MILDWRLINDLQFGVEATISCNMKEKNHSRQRGLAAVLHNNVNIVTLLAAGKECKECGTMSTRSESW